MFNEDNTPDLEQDDNNSQEEELVEVEEESEDDTTTQEDDRLTALEAENKKLKAILDRNKGKKKTEITKSKSDGFGYDVKAYLKASGIDSTEFDFVQNELKQSGLSDVDALLSNEYFQARLEKQRELTKTKLATPPGRRSSAVATDTVEYWASKPFAEVPRDMKAKVVAYRQQRESSKGVFYNS